MLLASIGFNFFIGRLLASANAAAKNNRLRPLLVTGVAGNLALLGWFKYAGFLASNLNALLGTHFNPGHIELPLGISFFTFTQIAFLIDTARGEAREYSALNYGLFVTYFPHLIAGPILHHREMMPQFATPRKKALRSNFILVGLACFAIGLAKKTLIADSLAPYTHLAFDSPVGPITLFTAWGGALAYTFQLYFDFSGYSDMAIGLSLMFGIRLPINFNSPYKATNIIDFWRRWHITLSRFLRDYLYIPLGGNRRGPARRWFNLLITMVLGGLWHGAGWTYALWGGLHGIYLVLNHAWRALLEKIGVESRPENVRRHVLGRLVTFVSVVFAWVLFRAPTMSAAERVISGMIGHSGIALPMIFAGPLAPISGFLKALRIAFDNSSGTEFVNQWTLVIVAAGIAFLAPNTQEILARYPLALQRAQDKASRIHWRLSPRWAFITGLVLAAGLLSLSRPQTFLYFQF